MGDRMELENAKMPERDDYAVSFNLCGGEIKRLVDYPRRSRDRQLARWCCAVAAVRRRSPAPLAMRRKILTGKGHVGGNCR